MRPKVIFFLSILVLSVVALVSGGWGFYAHRQINTLAVYSLPPAMLRFYKNNAWYLAAHSVDPDKKRYIDTLEAGRHFIDVEDYEPLIDSIPQRYNAALAKYGRPALNKNGTVPWQINLVYGNLVKAFQQRDSVQILKLSANLGHYISDAHSPLHTTKNYNGQLTGQVGIHALWESRIPELFAKDYHLFIGKAQYYPSALKAAWAIVLTAHTKVDSVLLLEKYVRTFTPAHNVYSIELRNRLAVKNYSSVYAGNYQQALNNMVERQMRSSIKAVASFWYSAWVDAGQPSLDNMPKVVEKPTAQEKAIAALPDMEDDKR